MSDLLSRSELIEEIKSLSIVLNGKQIFSDDAKDTVLRIIKEQPTAYDVDKVVEELKKELSLAKKEKEKCTGENHLQFYSTKGYAGGISYAIEIVKQGGVSEDILREAKQGKWILDEFTAKYGNPYRCSCCNIEFGDTYNYCPNCGASMKEAK